MHEFSKAVFLLSANNVSDVAVFLMGFGTVFVGLICIIILCRIMSMALQDTEKGAGSTQTKAVAAAPAQTAVSAAAPAGALPDRQAMIAAVTCAIAESLGTDVTGIRVVSFKKV